jgi:transcriptional regulator with XRE-family HTH domain
MTAGSDNTYDVARPQWCYGDVMVSASLLVQARRRAGLSQRELGARAGVAQQEIARYERGRVTPSLERLRALIAACGLELTLGLARADDSYDEQIAAALALEPVQRLPRALRDAEPMRAARARQAGTSPPPPVDVIGVLRALNAAGARYVLVGEVAEALHGSPLLTIGNTVTIVPRAGQHDRLAAAITAAAGQPSPGPADSVIDGSSHWTLDAYGAELVATPAPAATQGYDDLYRDANQLRVGDDVTVAVASLVDLVRIAEAGDGGARVPALRRTLELARAADSAGSRAA